MPRYMEEFSARMKKNRPRYRPSLDFVNEEEISRTVFRETENSPLLRVVQEESVPGFAGWTERVLSSETGVELNGVQEELLTHNRILEARISLSILDHPGEIGYKVDAYSAKVRNIFAVLLNDAAIGDQNVTFNGQPMRLQDVFDRTTFTPLKPLSDQIGRMPGNEDIDVKQWLIETLGQKLSGENENENENEKWRLFLTKIKGLSSFGGTLWQLLTVQLPEAKAANQQAVRRLISAAGLSGEAAEAEDIFNARFQEFRDKTRSGLFDDPVTRARSERMPLINGIPVRGIYTDAAGYGLGFGQVVQTAETAHETKALREALDGGNEQEVRGSNRKLNAIARLNAPIEDLNRPFMLSGGEFNNLPERYREFNLEGAMRDHYFNHGVGINRWQPYGVYGMDANRNGYPSAGSQSGGTTDVMLALTMLDLNEKTSIYNREEKGAVLCMTAAVAAFMNFGGYHTFSEVLPIGQAVAENKKFVPAYVSGNFRYGRLYKDMMNIYETYGDANEYKRLAIFEAQHRRSTLPIKYTSPGGIDNTGPDIFQSAFITRTGALPEREHYPNWSIIRQ